ncbi:MAG: HDOD domain-containing protein [Oceanospirillaceae bacterium]|nr:HDOD domain-containing protein [Oceanospirillaceae bacterium]
MNNKFIAGKPYVIPPRPETLKRVINALKNDEVSIDEVVSILQQDVSLYSAVLATANTPLFNSGAKITSLSQSVMRLGFSKMITILRIIALKTALSKVDRLDSYWNTATEIAQLMVKISQMMIPGSTDNAYSVGMMHNCGITLMMEAIPEYRQFIESVAITDLQQLLEQEQQQYQINHFQVSTEIARRWLMPDIVVEAIRLQGSPIESAGLNNSHNEQAKMLFCALVLAKDVSSTYHNFWRIKTPHDDLLKLTPVLHFIGLSETDYLDFRANSGLDLAE